MANLRGMTFTVPTADVATADAIIAKFPKVVDKKIPMRCQYNAAAKQWECDVHTFWERREVWWAFGAGFGGFILGALVGRATK